MDYTEYNLSEGQGLAAVKVTVTTKRHNRFVPILMSFLTPWKPTQTVSETINQPAVNDC